MVDYVESPFEQIISIHLSKKPGGGDGGGPLPPGPCGSGWLPFAGYFPGGDGFPPQLNFNQPANLLVHGQVLWNFPVAQQSPPDPDNPEQTNIPGGLATGLTISVVWAGVLGPVTGSPLFAGIWVYPDSLPFPPYNDSNGLPPPNPYPIDPDVSAAVVGSGSIEVSFTAHELSPESPSITVVCGFAEVGGGSRSRAAQSAPLLFPSPHAGPHYGWPGNPPSEGIWIEVDYQCP